MADVSGVDNLTSSSNGSTSLAGIKSAVDNLNTAKAEVGGQVFTGAISATNLSGTNTGDQTLPTDATLSTSDITTNNASSTKHGFVPKSPADATKFLNGAATPAYANPKDSDLALTDVTTNNVSTSAHGFAPKAPNDSTKFLNGANPPAWAVPGSFAFKAGTTSKTVSDASTAQTIAHGLGKTPQVVRITCEGNQPAQRIFSFAVYNGTTTAEIHGFGSATTWTDGADTKINITDSGGSGQTGVITFDATNITITWTKVSAGTWTAQILWEAIG